MMKKTTGHDARRASLITQLPGLEHPLVGLAPDLKAAAQVVARLPELRFPIRSAGEFITMLGGEADQFEIWGWKLTPAAVARFTLSHYFPIASRENLIEKMAEIIGFVRRRRARAQQDLHAVKDGLREQFARLRYPLESPEGLLEVIGAEHMISLRGRPFDLPQAIRRIPAHFYPIPSAEDLDQKLLRLFLQLHGSAPRRSF